MADLVEAARLEQLAPGHSLFVYVGETGVALFNIDGTIYAINDTCLHQGSSLAQRRLNGNIVTCRAHGWKYDVTSGRLASTSRCISSCCRDLCASSDAIPMRRPAPTRPCCQGTEFC